MSQGMFHCSQELAIKCVLCCQSTPEVHRDSTAQLSWDFQWKAFTKWGSCPPNIDSNLTHNHTELHGFRRLASTPLILSSQPREIGIFIPFLQMWKLRHRVEFPVQDHSQEVAQCQDLNPGLYKGFFPSERLPSSFLWLWVVQRLTVGQAKLVLVFYKLPAKKFLRLWSSIKK